MPFHKHGRAAWSLAFNMILLLAGVITVKSDFEIIGIPIFAIAVLWWLVWLFFFLRSLHKENEGLRHAAEAGGGDARSRLHNLYVRGEVLVSTWEEGHPAGPEAWRTDVSKLYQEAEQLIRHEYSPEEAAGFRAVRPEDARSYRTNQSRDPTDLAKREYLLDAKLRFIYELLHSSGHPDSHGAGGGQRGEPMG